MSFQYNQRKGSDDHGSQWTSYSDLFMGLSVVFLLLYVTSSLRSGTTGLQQQIEKERLTQQVQDLQNQLKVYDAIKKEQLNQTPEEEKVYSALIDKLDLLKEDAKTEKDKLRQAALENEQKETALNQYQQLVRNMINANMIAKTRIRKRDDIIVANKKEITELSSSVQEKEQQISENERKIALANQQLSEKMEQLKYSYRNQKLTKKAFESKVAELKKNNLVAVSTLKDENKKFVEQLSETASELESTKDQLSKTAAQAKNLVSELQSTKGQFENKINQLKSDFEKQKSTEKELFESQLNAERLSSQERANREAKFRAAADAKAKAMSDQVAGLNSKMKETEGQLAKALAEANARKNIATEIKAGFAKAGIKAEVNPETGDVMIDFGSQYFDSGKADLKTGMVEVLKKAFPIYSSSLMENPKVKMKVNSVEIVGFASPTYKGKLVDPNMLKSGDRQAVDYNLDLSYARARSIFQYLFDPNKMTFKHQREILPLVKVTGRSFLSEAKNMRNIANTPTTTNEFCEKYDCKKAQRVIIKFGFDN